MATKYPNGRFHVKPCRWCESDFQPEAPSHLYCSADCVDNGKYNAYFQRQYGISYVEYQRMYTVQNGACYLCGGEGFLMAEWHQHKMVVDHCHTTGNVRGLLCHNCNRALGLLQDDPEVMERAAEYVRTGGRCNDYPHGE